jgi:hypothetical protein
MPKTMKQAKAIIKRYLADRVKMKRAVADRRAFVASGGRRHQAAFVAQQAAIVVQQQNAIAAHQAALTHANSIIVQHQAALQARHDQALRDHASDDEWLIAFEYENEEWESDV